MKIFSLKYDDVFREVMSYEGIRKQLISDVTGIPLEKIKTATLESPFLWKRYRYQKQGILDVLVTLDNGTRIDIELQVHISESMAEAEGILSGADVYGRAENRAGLRKTAEVYQHQYFGLYLI